MYSTLRTARCIIVPHSVSEHRSEFPSRRNLGRVSGLLQCVCGRNLPDTSRNNSERFHIWQTPSVSCQPGETLWVKLRWKEYRKQTGNASCKEALELVHSSPSGSQMTAMKRATTNDPFRTALRNKSARQMTLQQKVTWVAFFAVTKKLKSRRDRPLKVIHDENGVFLVDEGQVAVRWRSRWAELLHGQETKWSEAKHHTGRKRPDLFTLHDLQSPLVRRHRRKATGLGGIPISVWQAGGDSSARKLLALLNTTRVLGRCAVGMRCGRVGELYKHEGDRNETKSHRGILVQDRPGAIHASFMKCDIDEQHMKFIHETQCGARKAEAGAGLGRLSNEPQTLAEDVGGVGVACALTKARPLRVFTVNSSPRTAHVMCGWCNPRSKR